MGQLSEPTILKLLERPDLVAELEAYQAARDGGDDEIAGRAGAELVAGLQQSSARLCLKRRSR